jgi:DNA integrity scanning protein DisA with diadenylate cyclase activity
VVFWHSGLEHYPRLIEVARSRLAVLELDDGVEKSKVDSVRSRLFGVLRLSYHERDPAA